MDHNLADFFKELVQDPLPVLDPEFLVELIPGQDSMLYGNQEDFPQNYMDPAPNFMEALLENCIFSPILEDVSFFLLFSFLFETNLQQTLPLDL